MHETSVTITRDDQRVIRRSLVEAALSRPLRIAAPIVFPAALIAMWLLSTTGHPAAIAGLWIIAALEALALLLYLALRLILMRAVKQQLPLDSVLTMQVDGLGVVFKRVEGETTAAWASIVAVSRQRGAVVFRRSEGAVACIVPERLVTGEVRHVIESRLG